MKVNPIYLVISERKKEKNITQIIYILLHATLKKSSLKMVTQKK